MPCSTLHGAGDPADPVLDGRHPQRARPVTYNLTNAAIATVWACGIGYSSYYLGPAVLDFVSDLGTGLSIALGVVVAA